MKIVLAFDSFKGGLSAGEACEAAADGIHSVRPDIEIAVLPMADGGEGTAEVLRSARGGEWIPLAVTGPLPHMKVRAGYVWLERDRIAVVEMAAAGGLPLLKLAQRNPLDTTTFGTGELMAAAIQKGARKIFLTVGGSATVDGGIGAAAALGWRFLNAAGQEVPLSGRGLRQIEKMVPPPVRAYPELDVLCDVTNPLCGPNGAARIFGPQKGATPEMVESLEAGLAHLAATISQQLGVNVADVPGAGAAGGLAAGAAAFLGGKLVRGIDTVMNAAGMPDALKGADWVLTGEGRFDSQSLHGKVADGVARLAKHAGVRAGVIAGSVQLTETEWRAAGILFAVSLQTADMTADEAVLRSRMLLFERAAAFAGGLQR